MNILFDGRPIREPLSGVANYCINLSNSLCSILNSDSQLRLYLQNRNNSNLAFESIREHVKSKVIEDQAGNVKAVNLMSEFSPKVFSRRIKKNYTPDICHETYFANLGNYPQCKKIVTIHDVIPLEYPNYFNFKNRLFTKKNLQRQCREADHIICVSEYTKKKVIEYYRGNTNLNISVVPCGVPDVSKPKSYDLSKFGLKRGSYLFYIGNIEPRKNLESFAKVVENVVTKERLVDLKFVVAGHMNFAAQPIVSKIKETLKDRFVYLGKISDVDKWGLMANSKLVVFPSIYEGFGIPIIEAYQVKSPILFSNTSSMSELSVHESQLFNPFDLDDMEQKLKNGLINSDRMKENVMLSQLKLNNYRWDNVARKIYGIYVDLLNGVS